MTDTPRQKLFASYIEITYDLGGDRGRRRRQLLVLPPRPDRFNGTISARATETFPLFHREQNSSNHRAVWKYMTVRGAEELANEVNRYVRRGWTSSPLVTVEINMAELDKAISDHRTPYSIIERVRKVAARNHGFAV